jgi:SAM-dependent methyltransferase
MKLNIGCGESSILDSIGLDIIHTEEVDVLGTAEQLPFKENSFDTIYLDNILEHSPETVAIIEEIYRVSKPGGLIHIWVPYGTNKWYIQDPTHKMPFNEKTFDYFTNTHDYGYYTDVEFKINEVRYKMWDHTLIKLLNHLFPTDFLRDFIPNSTVAMYIQLECIKEAGEPASATRQIPEGRLDGFEVN